MISLGPRWHLPQNHLPSHKGGEADIKAHPPSRHATSQAELHWGPRPTPTPPQGAGQRECKEKQAQGPVRFKKRLEKHCLIHSAKAELQNHSSSFSSGEARCRQDKWLPQRNQAKQQTEEIVLQLHPKAQTSAWIVRITARDSG